MNRLEGIPAQLGQGDLGVYLHLGLEVGLFQPGVRQPAQTLLEVRQVLRGQGEAGRLGVPAEVGHQFMALVQCLDDIEFGDAAAAAAAGALPGADDDGGAVELVGHPAGHQPGDAQGVFLAVGYQQRGYPFGQHLLPGSVQGGGGHLLSLGVLLVQPYAELAGFRQ